MDEAIKTLHSLDSEDDSKSSGGTIKQQNCEEDGFMVTKSQRKLNTSQTDPPRKRKKVENTDTITGELTNVLVENVSKAEERVFINVEQLMRRENGSPSSSRPSASQQNSWRTCPTNTSRACFEAKYQQFDKLGEGHYGSVYAGIRRADNLPVAIKRIPKRQVVMEQVMIKWRIYEVPLEGLLMETAAGGPESVGKCPAVSFLDWYDLDPEVLLVMERPVPSVNLQDYLEDHGPLSEAEAKIIMKQLVEAAIQLLDVEVLHSDIKAANVLIQRCSEGLRVLLIDFGMSYYINHEYPFSQFFGKWLNQPRFTTYRKAELLTIVQLGTLMYNLLGLQRFATRMELCDGLILKGELSHDCQEFLRKCLQQDVKKCTMLDQMLQHPWLT